MNEGCWPGQFVAGPAYVDVDRVIQLLIRALSFEDCQVRRAAHNRLVNIGAPAVDPLIDSLRSDDDRLVEAAIMVLLEIKDSSAVEPLIDLLESASWYFIRSVAADALGVIGDKRAVNALIKSLDDTDNWSIRSCSAYALAQIGDNRAADALVSKLNDENVNVCYAAAKALLAMGDTRAVPTLIALQDSADYMLRRGARESLNQLNQAS
jgi:HEAT repeat protein